MKKIKPYLLPFAIWLILWSIMSSFGILALRGHPDDRTAIVLGLVAIGFLAAHVASWWYVPERPECRWVQDVYDGIYYTSCDHRVAISFMQEDCPFCGKLIKEVNHD